MPEWFADCMLKGLRLLLLLLQLLLLKLFLPWNLIKNLCAMKLHFNVSFLSETGLLLQLLLLPAASKVGKEALALAESWFLCKNVQKVFPLWEIRGVVGGWVAGQLPFGQRSRWSCLRHDLLPPPTPRKPRVRSWGGKKKSLGNY